MREVWPKIQGKTALTEAEIEHAKEIGEQLVVAAGLREQGPAVVQDVARVRQQAFTLMLRAYDEVRRAVGFLRWKEGDADTIAPSLYAGRGGRGNATDTANAPAPPAAGVAPPAPPASPGVSAPVAERSNGAAQAVRGMPGGSPLAN